VRSPRLWRFASKIWTHGRVLGGAVPQPERVFLAMRRDPERHNQAVQTQTEGSQIDLLPAKKATARVHDLPNQGNLQRYVADSRPGH
jgi:hypothetical protein